MNMVMQQASYKSTIVLINSFFKKHAGGGPETIKINFVWPNSMVMATIQISRIMTLHIREAYSIYYGQLRKRVNLVY